MTTVKDKEARNEYDRDKADELKSEEAKYNAEINEDKINVIRPEEQGLISS